MGKRKKKTSTNSGGNYGGTDCGPGRPRGAKDMATLLNQTQQVVAPFSDQELSSGDEGDVQTPRLRRSFSGSDVRVPPTVNRVIQDSFARSIQNSKKKTSSTPIAVAGKVAVHCVSDSVLANDVATKGAQPAIEVATQCVDDTTLTSGVAVEGVELAMVGEDTGAMDNDSNPVDVHKSGVVGSPGSQAGLDAQQNGTHKQQPEQATKKDTFAAKLNRTSTVIEDQEGAQA